MDILQQQIEQQLIANMIKSYCNSSDKIIFKDSWSSHEKVIRFTTQLFREMFGYKENSNGKWKTGDSVMYEIVNETDSTVVNCVYSPIGKSVKIDLQSKAIINVCNASKIKNDNAYIIKSWNLDTQKDIINQLDELIAKKLPMFEYDTLIKVRSYSDDSEEFTEGEATRVMLNKYERNKKARAACINANGTACKICGFDFGKTYGQSFQGIIEVHHIVPISEIGKEYVVDPVKDLIPVCPNCHTAIHSKKDGVYLVDELIEIMNNSHK